MTSGSLRDASSYQTTRSKYRSPSSTCETARPLYAVSSSFGHVAGGQAVAGRLVAPDLQPHLRDLDLRLDLQVHHAGDLGHQLARRRGPRRASSRRSGPNTLTATWARTPDMMWSSRCEIGWPTLTFTLGRTRQPVADVGQHLVARPALTSRRRGRAGRGWPAARRSRPPGLAAARARRRPTSISEKLTPSACSSSSARPGPPRDVTSPPGPPAAAPRPGRPRGRSPPGSCPARSAR